MRGEYSGENTTVGQNTGPKAPRQAVADSPGLEGFAGMHGADVRGFDAIFRLKLRMASPETQKKRGL